MATKSTSSKLSKPTAPRNFYHNNRFLLSAAAFFGIMSLGLTLTNTLTTPRDLAFAQSNPNSPGGGTVITPGQVTTTPTTPTTNPTTPTTTTTTAPTVTAPVTPPVQNEQIVSSTGQVVPTTSTTTPDPTQPVVTASQVKSDNTVRSGGLSFTLAGIAVLSLGVWYYYYRTQGDPKRVLKMNEQRIKPTR